MGRGLTKKPSTRRGARRRAGRRRKRALAAAALCGAVCLIALFIIPRLFARGGAAGLKAEPTPFPTERPAEAEATPAGAETEKTPEPSPELTPVPAFDGLREPGSIDPAADPDAKDILLKQKVYRDKEALSYYEESVPIHFGPEEDYAALEGVTGFRGGNYRQNAAWGEIPAGASRLEIVWRQEVGRLDEWSGVGWTGQPAIVRWSEGTRRAMNLSAEKKDKDGLVEVIYAALDGKIRFLDLEDGSPTRKAIDIGAPIKGSVSVDPRGYPLLYCGQGIETVNGRRVKIGTRVFSLLSGNTLLFLNGRDARRTRNWYAFDSCPLIDAKTDTLFQLGENGLFYSIKLNLRYDESAPSLSIDPVITRYAYGSKVTKKRPGMENSISVYNHYAYFGDNAGLLTCLDLNTLRAVWAFPTGDDIDATAAIEESEDLVRLYTGNELDLRSGGKGDIQLYCLNALSGEVLWKKDVFVTDDTRGGLFASPVIGKGSLSELVFFNVSKTREGSTLFALDKKTGEEVWHTSLNKYSWSTPLALYDKNGRGVLAAANSQGILRLFDGLTGELLSSVDLGRNIEGSPAAFDDMLVVGTRGGTIYGVKIL